MSDNENITIEIDEPIVSEDVVNESISVDEPVTTVEEPVAPIEEPVVPVEEPVVPIEEPVAPVEEPVAPVEEPVAPVEEPVAPIEEPVAPVEEPVAPVEEPVVPVDEPVAPVDEPVAPVDEPVVPVDEPVAPVEEPVVPVEEPVAPIEEPVAPVEEPVAPVDEPVAPVEEPVAPVEEPVVPIEEPIVPIEEPIVPIEEPIVPIEEPVVPVDEPVAPVEEPVVPIEEPVVPVEEPVDPVGDITNIVPKIIFIVPYRDRVEQQRFFSFQMEKILEDYKKSEYKIIYAHQSDTRDFNRGAMKNIGFLYAKSLYPNDYRNITFVFNDVDTMPYNKNFLNYETISGNVKHFYGYEFTLGGIVSITGSDFEKVNGYPNYWSWGYEDNALNNRVNNLDIKIDRTQFYPILDKNILQLKDGITRIVNRGEFDRYVDEVKYQGIIDGINTISDISYTFDDNISFLNITTFKTPISERPELNKIHDIRDGNVPFLRKQPQRRRGTMGMIF